MNISEFNDQVFLNLPSIYCIILLHTLVAFTCLIYFMNEFWKTKTLTQFTKQEWDAVCDGCGKCCLYKLEDADTAEIHYCNVACRLLDTDTCRCTDYSNRRQRVPDCVKLTPALAVDFSWLPSTCAYRLLAAGEDLPDWHPLVSKDPETVHFYGISVRGRVISEEGIDCLEDYIVDWAY